MTVRSARGRGRCGCGSTARYWAGERRWRFGITRRRGQRGATMVRGWCGSRWSSCRRLSTKRQPSVTTRGSSGGGRADLGGQLVARSRRGSSPGWSWRPDGRCGAHGGGDVSGQRLLGAHLPAVFPERRETVVVGECLGCLTQFAIDARLPLPATCPDCGANVLANADITGEAQAQTAIQSVANPEDETMTLRFHRGSHPAGVDRADRTRRGCGRRTRCGDASVVERKV